jgi:hypothetical protein
MQPASCSAVVEEEASWSCKVKVPAEFGLPALVAVLAVGIVWFACWYAG